MTCPGAGGRIPIDPDPTPRCWQEDPPSRPVFDEILDMLERLADEEDVML